MRLFSFLRNSFFKNSAILFSGSVISQGVIFFSLLILTRLFDESVFGLYMLYTSSLFILKPITSLNLELAILLPKEDKDAVNFVFFNFLLGILLNLIVLLVLFLFQSQIVSFFQITDYQGFIYLIPFSLFLINLSETFNYWKNRQESFTHIATGNVVKSTTIASSQIYTGFSIYNSLGMIPGHVIGLIVQFFTLTGLSIKSLRPHLKHISFRRMLVLVKKYKDIPIYNSLLSFSDQLSAELPIVLIANFFGVDKVALYGLASKVLKTPPGLVSQSVGQVFFNKATSIYNKGENLYTFVWSTYKKLFVIGIGLFTCLFILSFFLDLVLGENWVDVGIYVRILTPLIFFAFLNAPISSIITILNKQKVILIIDILKLVLRFVGIYIGYAVYDNILISVALFSGIGVIYNLFIFIYFIKISRETRSNSYS